MGEVSLRHEGVGLNDLVNVGSVNANSHTHDHVLWSLDDLAVDAKKVRSLKGLEAKVVVGKVAVVDDGRVEHVLVGHDDLVDVIGDHRCVLASLGVDPRVKVVDDLGEDLLGLLVEVGDGDTGCEDGIVGVLCGKVGGCLGCQVLFDQLN